MNKLTIPVFPSDKLIKKLLEPKFENTCPECGSYLKCSYRMLSPDDYCKEWECMGCGMTWSK